MVQLLHARALLSGSLALPVPGDPAAWLVQNSMLVPAGWVSVYPPLHTLLLATGLALRSSWLVGPTAVAVTAGVSVLVVERLFPGRPALARAAGILISASPYLAFLGGTHLSHTTAGALAALTIWTALRARDGGWAWSVAAGASAGAFVCARPWTGMALSAAVISVVWSPTTRGSAGRTPLARRTLGLVAGGLPFALLLFAWNLALFGHPLRLGYEAAFGPAHGLGLHPDPWGNEYGLLEAIAYTGSDLVQLGIHLLETPLPAVALIGIGLLLSALLPSGMGPLLAWAGAGVAANAVYWHHGIHMGPRLLYETGPAWVTLWVVSVAALIGGGSPLSEKGRRVAAWAVLLSLGAGVLLAPGRARAYRPSAEATASSRPPEPGEAPALVFVHGTWASRVSARLVSAGMRRDSVETALRRNDLCAVDRYARWRRDRTGAPPPLDFESSPGRAPGLEPRRLSAGNDALVREGAPFDGTCLREAASDRFGVLELEPLLWQAPPVAGTDLVVARDLGPVANELVQAAFPNHGVFAAVPGEPGTRPRVLPYAEAMTALWGRGPDGL
jgi:hypothetical protein